MNLAASQESSPPNAPRARLWPRQLEAAAATAVLLFAAAVRLVGIAHLPPGLFQDEAVNGVNVYTILAGHPHLYYGEREPLFMYTLALVSLVLNPSTLALRVTAALVSVAAVACGGGLARRLFGPVIGVLTAFGMASSVWLTTLGRTTFRANEVPVFEALGLAVLWRATQSGRTRDYIAGGTILGLSLYTYLAARFIPIVLVVFALVCFVGYRSWMRQQLRGFLIAAAAAVVVLLPLGYYAYRHPTVILGRPDQVALPGGSEFFPALVGSSLRTVGMIVVRGDVTWRHNLSNMPVFDPLNGVFFFVGFLLLLRWRRPGDLLILTTLVVMMLPGMLSLESPHFLRTIGTPVALYTIWAVGLFGATRFVARRIASIRFGSVRAPQALRLGLPVLVGALLVWTGYRDVRSYFIDYAQSPTMPGSYNVNLVAAGQVLAADPLWQTSRDNVYITDTYTDSIASLAYWPYSKMTPSEKTSWLDEASLGTYFTQDQLIPLPMAPSLYLLTPDSPSGEVEAALQGSIQRRQQLAGGNLPHGQAIWADSMSFPDSSIAQFATLALETATVIPSEPRSSGGESGRWTLRLRWRVTGRPSYSPSIFVHVEDDRGHTIAQADQEMHLSLDHFRVDQRLASVRTIDLPVGTLPGQYFVSVGVYDKVNGKRETILVNRQPSVPPKVATIALAAPVTGGPASPSSQSVAFSSGLTLVQAGGWPATVEAGSKVPIVLTWQTLGLIRDDRQVTVLLRRSDGQVISSANSSVGAADYPTSRWPARTYIQQVVDLAVSPLASGSATLSVQVGSAVNSGSDQSVDVGTLNISAAQHVFDLPQSANSVDVRYSDAGRLVGWSSGPPIHSGEPFRLRLVWEASGQSAAAYTVFVHLLDQSGAIVGQRDEEPGHGTRPTTGWVPGEYVVDFHDVDVPLTVAPGNYRVEIGLYDARTGQRVPLVTGPDGAIIGVVEVAPK